MKKWIASLLVLLAVVIAWILSARRSEPEPRGISPESQKAAIQAALGHATPAATAAIESAFAPAPSARDAVTPTAASVPPAQPAAEAFTNVPPLAVMENVQRAFRDYAARFGGNPVGTNPEITRALAGDNPRQVNFLDEESGVRANAGGELVDPWGVPFFLHQLAAREMEVRSAGPDRRMWTEDDLVVK